MDGATRGLVYVGSANFSQNAFGQLVNKNRDTCICSNIELGVVLVTEDAAQLSEWRSCFPHELEAHAFPAKLPKDALHPGRPYTFGSRMHGAAGMAERFGKD